MYVKPKQFNFSVEKKQRERLHKNIFPMNNNERGWLLRLELRKTIKYLSAYVRCKIKNHGKAQTSTKRKKKKIKNKQISIFLF